MKSLKRILAAVGVVLAGVLGSILVLPQVVSAMSVEEQYILEHPSYFQPDSPNPIPYLLSQYSENFVSSVVQTWAHASYAGAHCEALIGTCDFYLCQETKSSCGLKGYNLGYGFKYCSDSKFKLYQQMSTDAGRSWVTQVFQCLQTKNFSQSQLTPHQSCGEVKSNAYAAHPDCYYQAGFCELPLVEKFKIINTIKSEIYHPETIEQALKVLMKCPLSGLLVPEIF